MGVVMYLVHADVVGALAAAMLPVFRKQAKALEAYEQSMTLDPNNDAAWANTGRLLVEMGELDLGIDLLAAAVLKQPRDVQLLLTLSTVSNATVTVD